MSVTDCSTVTDCSVRWTCSQIFNFIVYRHYVTQRQNTFLFNMTCTCMLKIANKASFIIIIAFTYFEAHQKHRLLRVTVRLPKNTRLPKKTPKYPPNNSQLPTPCNITHYSDQRAGDLPFNTYSQPIGQLPHLIFTIIYFADLHELAATGKGKVRNYYKTS